MNIRGLMDFNFAENPVPLEEVAGKLKMVDPKDPLIQEIKDMGICFGDSL